MSGWRGTPTPRPTAVAAPGPEPEDATPEHLRGLACVSPGAAVVVRALLGEGLARPVAGSGDCWISRGLLDSWGCLLEPRGSRSRSAEDSSAGAGGSCLLISPVAQSACGAGGSAGGLSGLGDERERFSVALVRRQPDLQVARAGEVEQILGE